MLYKDEGKIIAESWNLDEANGDPKIFLEAVFRKRGQWRGRNFLEKSMVDFKKLLWTIKKQPSINKCFLIAFLKIIPSLFSNRWAFFLKWKFFFWETPFLSINCCILIITSEIVLLFKALYCNGVTNHIKNRVNAIRSLKFAI